MPIHKPYYNKCSFIFSIVSSLSLKLFNDFQVLQIKTASRNLHMDTENQINLQLGLIYSLH